MADNDSLANKMNDSEDDDGLDLGLYKIKNPVPGATDKLKQGARDARDSALHLILQGGPAGDSDVADALASKPVPGKSEYMSPDELKAFGQAPPPRQAKNFAPTPTGQMPDDQAGPPSEDDSREHIRQAIKNVESSGGNYGAVNDGAYGAYQFRPKYWNELSQSVTGHDVQDLVPVKGDTPEVQQQKKADQDKLFNAYYSQQMVPWVKAMRKDGLGDQYSDTQLAGLFHFRGATEGQDFLEGKVGDSDKGGTTIKNYLARIDAGAKGSGGGDRTQLGSMPQGAKQTTAGKPDLMDRLGSDDNGQAFLDSFQTDPGRMAAASLQRAAEQGGDSFDAQLAKISQTYQGEKDEIAKREIAHTLADAFTKLGAGMMGMKTGVDMSHIDTGKHDFQKDYELAQGERKTSLDDLKARREEQQRSQQHDSEMTFQKMKTAAELHQSSQRTAIEVFNAIKNNDHQGAQEAIAKSQQEYERAHLAYQQDRADEQNQLKLYEAFETRKAAGKGKIAGILNSKEYQKDPKAGNAAIELELTSLGVKPDQAHNAVFKKGLLWGQNPQDPEDMIQQVNQRVDMLTPNPLHSDGVVVQTNGKQYHFTNQASADEFKRKAGM